MNVDTYEIKPDDEVTPAERKSGRWITLPPEKREREKARRVRQAERDRKKNAVEA